MSAHQPQCVWDLGAELGEGPVWLAAEQALWFVDIKAPRICRFDPATGEGRFWPAPEPVGFLAPIRGGGFVAGLKSGLHRFDSTSGRFDLIARVEPPELGNRLNDGFVDLNGRLWFGSMHDPEVEASGALYRLGDDGSIVRCDGGYRITNGPATSPDGRVFYHTDSALKVIYAFDLDAAGHLGERRVFARIVQAGAVPDGSTVDEEGCLWSALWGGWGLERFAPSGERIGRIDMPCANITKAAFGDPDLKTLYVTTAWKGLTPDERRGQPLAGCLFSLRVDVAGLPQNELIHGL